MRGIGHAGFSVIPERVQVHPREYNARFSVRCASVSGPAAILAGAIAAGRPSACLCATCLVAAYYPRISATGSYEALPETDRHHDETNLPRRCRSYARDHRRRGRTSGTRRRRFARRGASGKCHLGGIRPPHGRGPGRRTGREGAPPDAPPVYALGGVTYPHTTPMQSDRDHGVLFGKIGTPARQAGTR